MSTTDEKEISIDKNSREYWKITLILDFLGRLRAQGIEKAETTYRIVANSRQQNPTDRQMLDEIIYYLEENGFISRLKGTDYYYSELNNSIGCSLFGDRLRDKITEIQNQNKP